MNNDDGRISTSRGDLRDTSRQGTRASVSSTHRHPATVSAIVFESSRDEGKRFVFIRLLVRFEVGWAGVLAGRSEAPT